MNLLIAHTKSTPLSRRPEAPISEDSSSHPPPNSPTKSKSQTVQTPTRLSKQQPASLPAGQSLFHSYAARITLHHAHLAHAKGRTERARQCYRVAIWLSSPEDDHANATQPRVKLDAVSSSSKKRGKGKANGGSTRGRGKASGKGRTRNQSSDETPTKTKANGQKSPVDGDLDEEEEVTGEGRRRDPWVHACARAGEIALRIGELAQKRVDRIQVEKERRRGVKRKPQQDSDFEVDMSSEPAFMFPPPDGDDDDEEDEDGRELLKELQMEAKEEEDVKKLALEVAEECEGLGGVLCAVGEVLRSCVSEEYLKGK